MEATRREGKLSGVARKLSGLPHNAKDQKEEEEEEEQRT